MPSLYECTAPSELVDGNEPLVRVTKWLRGMASATEHQLGI